MVLYLPLLDNLRSQCFTSRLIILTNVGRCKPRDPPGEAPIEIQKRFIIRRQANRMNTAGAVCPRMRAKNAQI